MDKKTIIHVRVTAEERKLIETAAREAGMPMATFCRSVTLARIKEAEREKV